MLPDRQARLRWSVEERGFARIQPVESSHFLLRLVRIVGSWLEQMRGMATLTEAAGDGKPHCFLEGRWNPQHFTRSGTELRQDLSVRSLRQNCSIDAMEKNSALQCRTPSFRLRY